MIYNGTSFNSKFVKRLTLKQFLLLGSIGNKLTQPELKEAYTIITTAKPEVTGVKSSVKNSVTKATALRLGKGKMNAIKRK